jgi:2-phospho-L-lactate guanylyltransferase
MKPGSFWVLIPSQAFERGKSRLAAVLDPKERTLFSRACLTHVVRTARSVVGARHTVVVSASDPVLEVARALGARALRERRHGLNAAVRQAADFARMRGARGVVVLHGDLALLRRREVAFMVEALARHGGVVIAPDRRNAGTNALGVGASQRFRFRFGPGSYVKHLAEARRRRARVRVVRSAGLAQDVDTPRDYRALGVRVTSSVSGPSRAQR